MLSKEQHNDFEQNGYLVIENVLDTVAVKHIRQTAEKDAEINTEIQINKNFEGAVKSTRTSELQKLRGLLQPEDHSESCFTLRLQPRTEWNSQGIP